MLATPAPPYCPDALPDTFLPAGDITLTACGLHWDSHDIARFLSYVEISTTSFYRGTPCHVWSGAKSKGQGNTYWYGSFRISSKPGYRGKTVRAHKFAGVAILGLRPTQEDHLDHACQNSLCVVHLQQISASENLRLRWSRLDPEPFDHLDMSDPWFLNRNEEERWRYSDEDRC